MEHDGYLTMQALAAKGSVFWQGDQLEMLLIETRGSLLHIYGKDSLHLSNRSERFLPRKKYHYFLREADAAALFAALRTDYGDTLPPETVVMRSFEFTDPLYPLRDYLDEHHIAYEYVTDEILL